MKHLTYWKVLWVLAVIAGTGAAPIRAIAQVPGAVETQVAFAPESGVFELTPELRGQLGLFAEIQGFRVARLLSGVGGSLTLEIESQVGGELRRERRPLGQAELLELRARIAALGGGAGGGIQASGQGLDQSGRGGFVLRQTLLGLGFYGWAVPVALDIESAQAAVATYLLTAGLSFYLPYRLTIARSVTEEQRDLSLYGGSRGVVYGLLLGSALTQENNQYSGSDTPLRVRLATGVGVSVAGAVAGYSAGGGAPNEGTASLWGAMGDIGLAGGALFAHAAGPYATRTVLHGEGDFVWEEQVRRNPRIGHLITIGGGLTGLAAGRWLGERGDYTRGDVSVLRSATVLGGQVGWALGRAIAGDHARGMTAGIVLGGIAGVAGGDRLLEGRSFSTGDGFLVNAGHLAGWATAWGLTYLATNSIDEHPVLFLTTGALGSAAGAELVLRAVGGGRNGADARASVDPRVPRVNLSLRLAP